MKSKTLRNVDREAIVASITKDVFAEEKAAILAQEHSLALECYNQLYIEADRKILQKHAKGGWFRSRSSICVKVGSTSISLNFAKPVPVKASWDSSWSTMLVLGPTTKLGEKLTIWDNSSDDLEKSRQDFKAQIGAILKACRTTKQLLDTWPESQKWWPACLTRETAQVPMVPVADVNQLICDKLGPKSGAC